MKNVITFFVTAIAISTSATAVAKTGNITQVSPSSSSHVSQPMMVGMRHSVPYNSKKSKYQKHCLTEIATGKRICKTRKQWEDVARQLEQSAGS